MDGDRGTITRVRSNPQQGGIAGREAFAAVVAIAVAALLFWACGGTTGRDGEAPAEATEGGADATMNVQEIDASAPYDTGAFDVDILYVDRPLPDVTAPPEGGGDAGAGWDSGLPNCPPWIPVDSMGNVVNFGSDPSQPVPQAITGSVVNFLPSDYSQDGGIEPAADGSTCATFPYYSNANKDCLINNFAGGEAYSVFPPCNWAVSLGKAQTGPAALAGLTRYEACVNLYNCIQGSGCWDDGQNLHTCFCGDAGGCEATPKAPSGPCLEQVQAALEEPDLSAKSVAAILGSYEQDYAPGPPTTPVSYGSVILYIYSAAVAYGCHPVASQP